MAFRPEVVALIAERKRAYELTIGGKDTPNRTLVLADLSRFCRLNESCFHADPRIHALIEGRREVILRIHDYLNLSVDELCQKYGKE